MSITTPPQTRFEPPPKSIGSDRPAGVLSLTDIFDVLIKHRRVWLLTPVIVGLISAVAALVMTPQFRSSASFFPETTRSASGGLSDALGAQAASLGIDIGRGGSKDGELYLDLMNSRDLRERVVLHSYSTTAFSGDLVDFFDLADIEPRALAVEKASRELAARTRAGHDLVSGVITLSVTTHNAEVARQVVEQYLAELEAFNRGQRSAHARERVTFLQRQLEVATEDLRQLEDRAEDFLERNRAFAASPSLTFAKARLDRQLGISTGIVTRVQHQLEQSQLDLLQETPTISVIDQPSLPKEKIGPRRTLLVLTCTLLGLVAGLVIALLKEGFSRSLSALSPASQTAVERARTRLHAIVKLTGTRRHVAR